MSVNKKLKLDEHYGSDNEPCGDCPYYSGSAKDIAMCGAPGSCIRDEDYDYDRM